MSGYLELAVIHLLQEFARAKAPPMVARFATSRIRIRSPKMQQILDLVGDFDKSWSADLKAYVEGERKDAVDSIVANRNLVAHGDHSGITIVRVRTYFARCDEVVKFLAKLVQPERSG